jgi:crotonobetainyl-CoA:carnitine CoA-transferase CaiB-like acyl-CoA transferase
MASAAAAGGAMMALYHRQSSGEGQHVDVSIREAMIVLTTTASPVPNWVEAQTIKQRRGSKLLNPSSGISK